MLDVMFQLRSTFKFNMAQGWYVIDGWQLSFPVIEQRLEENALSFHVTYNKYVIIFS